MVRQALSAVTWTTPSAFRSATTTSRPSRSTPRTRPHTEQTEVQDNVTQINWRSMRRIAPSGRMVPHRRRLALGLLLLDRECQRAPELRVIPPPGSVSPKVSLIFGPWAKTEFFINGGFGFHSNDVRAATEKVDPQYNLPQTRSCAARAGQRRRGRHPHGHHSPPAKRAHLLVPPSCLRADLRRRPRGHDPQFPEPSLRRRIGQLLHAVPWLTVDADIAYSVPRFIGRSGRQPDPGLSHLGRLRRGGCGRHARLLRFAAHALLRRAPADRQRRRRVELRARSSMPASATSSAASISKDWRLWSTVFNVSTPRPATSTTTISPGLPGEPPGRGERHPHPPGELYSSSGKPEGGILMDSHHGLTRPAPASGCLHPRSLDART